MSEADVDVLIVGAGVAGALLAWQLSLQGHKVLLVEAGPSVLREDALEQWAAAPVKTLSSPYRQSQADKFAFSPDGSGDYKYVATPKSFKSTYLRRVGGSTWHWQGSTPRLIPNDFRMRSAFGVAVDWPISYDDLEAWYARAEEALGVSGDHDAWSGVHSAWRSTPFPMTQIWPSYLDKVIAAKVNGLEFEGATLRVRTTPQARNSRPYQGRPPCAGNSICIPLCPIQAKYDATVHVNLALTQGAELLDRTVATKVVVANGSIDGIELAAWTETGEVQRSTLRARKYVIAAHSIESARLLLVSGIGDPAVVGHNLMDHPTGEMVGIADEPLYGYRGPPVTSGIDDWRDGPWRGDHAAWKMSLGNDGHGRFRTPEATVQKWMDEGLFGTALRERIADVAPRMVRISWASEQLPSAGNYVELIPQSYDALGMPEVRLNYSVDTYTLGSFVHARSLIRAIYERAGITNVEASADPAAYGGSGHVIGTCRMGTDAAASVVDADCRVHGHENLFVVGASVFPTAGTANPTLTAAALALRLAAVIATELPEGR
ncbi:GMC family oxidoreductase [Pseudomonas sp. FW215-R2]|uniref:GMC family oxidoreductase n=1 Tax=unclassified Pseudomonas TaxID=196821 RepID=UPI000C88C3C7|nr:MULTISPECIES: GMC family oxidoreductase [unclassified Pseudomonas]PMX03165.1 GMC family oxidoreductase [Pseudomonas sp. FW215-R2]PMX11870.1 GMC family oxidoreductase [Pseudomonas sp. FW215-L1]PMX25539.1 GMC family oxidoreductase [Pseudomonas sp. FW215-E1]PNA32541.1 GMC family oxidoreductase [Pseudomonas sp. FW215-R4]